MEAKRRNVSHNKVALHTTIVPGAFELFRLFPSPCTLDVGEIEPKTSTLVNM